MHMPATLTPADNRPPDSNIYCYRPNGDNIRVTSYEDGVYMRVLSIAFAELLPTEKAESYRRHGKWALSIHDPDNEIDWSTMRIDLSE